MVSIGRQVPGIRRAHLSLRTPFRIVRIPSLDLWPRRARSMLSARSRRQMSLVRADTNFPPKNEPTPNAIKLSVK